MSFFAKYARSNFFIRLKSWEYWPFGILQFPVFFYWFWLSLRARSPFFFSASNPGIPFGGMFGESKYEVLKKIPSGLVPISVLIKIPGEENVVMKKMHDAGLSFPAIFKPDIGERGWMVKRINTEEQAGQYAKHMRSDFIIQELVSLPHEFGVFYRRYPSEKTGKIISITSKEMLSVTGDGKRTLKELILQKDRAKLQWKKLRVVFHDQLNTVIPDKKKIELVAIGNHFQGTKFMDGSYLINDSISTAFDVISKQIDGFYFGRFDLRAASVEELQKGNVMIMELNGCGAEPAHIYDPRFKLVNALRVLLNHWADIFRISRENHQRGVKYLSIKEGIKLYRKFRSVIR